MISKVWFITGCSTGIGRELARQTLERGYQTVVTARCPEQVHDIVEGYDQNALVLSLDVTNGVQIAEAVRAAEERFGQIDVIVNNAGVGYFGAIEESDEKELRQMFEINFWGLSSMTRAALPKMRSRRTGTIVNISSIAGLVALPAIGYYSATKFAVEALSESLAQEVSPLGIRVILIEPGPFRTDWAGRSASERSTSITDYAETSGKWHAMLRDGAGKEPGDPVRAATAIIETVEAENPPLRLLLGKPALSWAQDKIGELQKGFDGWAKVTVGADFPSDTP